MQLWLYEKLQNKGISQAELARHIGRKIQVHESCGGENMSAWDLLNIEVIEAAALLSALSQNAVKYLQEELEGGEKWREKSMHMQAMKHFSEALEVMAVNPSVKTMRDWVEFHEQRRGGGMGRAVGAMVLRQHLEVGDVCAVYVKIKKAPWALRKEGRTWIKSRSG